MFDVDGERTVSRERLQNPIDLGSAEEEPLGSRRIAGVEAVGRRSTTTIHVENDRPMQIVGERWESPELEILIYSRSSDPRTGVIEYRLTNIRRTDPPPDLFVVPADFTIGGSAGEDWIHFEFAERLKEAKGAPR